jgi:hypothetical protein
LPRGVEDLDEILRDAARDDILRLGIPPDDPLYQYHFSVAPGTKVRGHVNWVQAPQIPTCTCGAAMSHLLTVATAEFDGAYQRWMPLEERHVWQEGFPARNSVQCAAGLSIGDMGDFYVFECEACEHRPISCAMQCS